MRRILVRLASWVDRQLVRYSRCAWCDTHGSNCIGRCPEAARRGGG